MAERQLLVQNAHAGRSIIVVNLMYPAAPVLQMACNPSSLELEFTKQVTVTHTAGAVVEEHWGRDNVAGLSGSGDTLSFSLPGPLVEERGSGPPTQVPRPGWRLVAGVERHRTPVGQNFHEFVQMFLNAGVKYNRRGQTDDFRGLLLVYDDASYLGYMPDLAVNETATKQHNWAFRFSFRATEVVLPRRSGP